jgi:hypothetical protein
MIAFYLRGLKPDIFRGSQALPAPTGVLSDCMSALPQSAFFHNFFLIRMLDRH